MSGIVRLGAGGEEHHCSPPSNVANYPKGTVWECPCGRQWKVVRRMYMDGVRRHCWKRKRLRVTS